MNSASESDQQRIETPYYVFNREERHLAAILFFLLQNPINRNALLNYAECNWEIQPEDFGIYYEYSYLRDSWYEMDRSGRRDEVNRLKRSRIIKMLRDAGASELVASELEPLSDHDFNRFFIGENRAPDGNRKDIDLGRYIQSPGNWRLPALDEKLEDADLVAACKVKWSFNCKPDLVIHTDRKHALCIELKLESKLGSYPAAGDEIRRFHKRKLSRIGQLDLQKFMMLKLLELDCHFLLISRRGGEAPDHLSWTDLRKMVITENLPGYMRYALEHA